VSDPVAQVRSFAEGIALGFDDDSLLRTALTHRSYLNEHPDLDWEDNERLEFLGDAVLDLLLAAHLFRAFPQAPEGELTALRAALVRRETLARFARTMELGEAMFMGHGEAESGGRERPATLCAGFEALVGALFIDQGLPAVERLVTPLVDEEMADARVEVAGKDPKSRLQEVTQSAFGVTPHYRTIRSEGPDHAKTFTVQVFLGDDAYGEGEGHSKRHAAQRAAAAALTRLEAEGPSGSLQSSQADEGPNPIS
jgi:ribonuclease III